MRLIAEVLTLAFRDSGVFHVCHIKMDEERTGLAMVLVAWLGGTQVNDSGLGRWPG
jgi:hypothetical protein